MKKTWLLILILSLLFLGLLILKITLTKTGFLAKPVSPPVKTSSQVTPQTAGRISLAAEIDAQGILKFYLRPADTVSLSAFDLRLLIKPDNGSFKISKLTPNPVLSQNGWSFPIKRVKSEGAGWVVELSGIRMAQGEYSMSNKLELFQAQIEPLLGLKNLILEIDQNVSQFYNREVLKIGIENPALEVPLATGG